MVGSAVATMVWSRAARNIPSSSPVMMTRIWRRLSCGGAAGSAGPAVWRTAVSPPRHGFYGLDRRAVAGGVVEPVTERERGLRVVPVVGEQPVAGPLVPGGRRVVADQRLVTAGIGDLPAEPGQRRDLLQAGRMPGDELAVEHAVLIDPLIGSDEGGDLLGQPQAGRDPAELGVLRGRVVAVGAQAQPGGGRVGAQLAEPAPELAEQVGLNLAGHRVPGAEATISGRRAWPAGPWRDQCAPQVDAVLGVLHVDVDLDVGARHPHPADAPAPVGWLVTERGPGQVDLPGQIAHRMVAVGRGARAE